MTYETLHLLRNLLLRTFVIGLVIVLLLGFATVAGWQTWTLTASEWLHADEITVTRVILEFFLSVRFFLLFIVLAPAIAIHWTLKRDPNLKR